MSKFQVSASVEPVVAGREHRGGAGGRVRKQPQRVRRLGQVRMNGTWGCSNGQEADVLTRL